MARNRKRAKDRRTRRPTAAPASGPGVVTKRAERDLTPDAIEHATPDVELAEAQLAVGRPEPAPEGSLPDGAGEELLGQPRAGDGDLDTGSLAGGAAPPGHDEALRDHNEALREHDEALREHDGALRDGDEALRDADEGFPDDGEAFLGPDHALPEGEASRGRRGARLSGSRGELTTSDSAVPASRRSAGARLITFLQGSWRELQRVQWPDRRQVMQATGVVIGFVIVAGIFLGVADALAGKVVTLILK